MVFEAVFLFWRVWFGMVINGFGNVLFKYDNLLEMQIKAMKVYTINVAAVTCLSDKGGL